MKMDGCGRDNGFLLILLLIILLFCFDGWGSY